jgi:hypothetical protein
MDESPTPKLRILPARCIHVLRVTLTKKKTYISENSIHRLVFVMGKQRVYADIASKYFKYQLLHEIVLKILTNLTSTTQLPFGFEYEFQK